MKTVTAEVGNPSDLDRAIQLEFLIDSGIPYAVVPRSVLDELGIAPVDEHVIRLSDGTEVVRDKGVALFRYKGRTAMVNVLFGEDDDSVIISPTTLEQLGFLFDPLQRTLQEARNPLVQWE